MTQHVIGIVHNLSAIRHTHKMQKRTNVNLTLATTVLLSDLLLAERWELANTRYTINRFS